MQKNRVSRLPVTSGRLLTISAMIAATLGAAACVPLAATGIALGAIAVIDRRTIGAQTEDQGIELKAVAELRRIITDPSGIAVTSFNRRVLLTGQVLSGIDKQNAGAAVAGLTNVRGVYNELEIAGKSSIGSDASDTALTTKVKTVLLRDRNVPGNSVKVKTEQGVVYLMGLVTHVEAQRAAELASQVSGVNRVITVFEILSPEEAERLSSSLTSKRPATGPAAAPAAPAAPAMQPGVPMAPPAGATMPGASMPVPPVPSVQPAQQGVLQHTQPGLAAPAPGTGTTSPAMTAPAVTPSGTTAPVLPSQPPLVTPPKSQ